MRMTSPFHDKKCAVRIQLQYALVTTIPYDDTQVHYIRHRGQTIADLQQKETDGSPPNDVGTTDRRVPDG